MADDLEVSRDGLSVTMIAVIMSDNDDVGRLIDGLITNSAGEATRFIRIGHKLHTTAVREEK